MPRIGLALTLLCALAAISATRPLPPISWTCPMHAEVVDNKSGACPICRMALVPIRLDVVWSCQLHPDRSQLQPGRCPIDGRDLVKMVKALSFTCRSHPKINDLDPGICPIDRRALVATYALRPHGDHNPKHGGQFFMAPNNWHVELTHPAAALFRLYVYDDYSRPFLPNGFSGRIVDAPGDGVERAAVSIPFRRWATGPVLEARIPKLGLPATIAVKVRFQANDQEYRFDFFFTDYSREPPARTASTR
jgi:hypothetical protein